VGEISIPFVEALPTTGPPGAHLMDTTVRLLSVVDWYKKTTKEKKRKFMGKT